MKQLLPVFTIFMMALLTVPPVMAGTDQQLTTSNFRFTELPHPDYYFRNYQLAGLKPVRDLRDRDSDEVISSNPQSGRGFKTSWLQLHQAVAPLIELTEVTMIDSTGGQVMIGLRIGESVVYDTRTKEILSVVRCANKVTSGNIKLPEPQKITVQVPVEKRIPVPQRGAGPISVYQDNSIIVIYQPPYHEEKKSGWWGRHGWKVGIAIGLATAGGAVWLSKNKDGKNWYPGKPPS